MSPHEAEALRDSLRHEQDRLTSALERLVQLRRDFPEVQQSDYEQALHHLTEARRIIRHYVGYYDDLVIAD